MADINSIDDLLKDVAQNVRKPGKVEVTVIDPSLTAKPNNPPSFTPNKNQPVDSSYKEVNDDLIFEDKSEVSKHIREICPWTQFEFPPIHGKLYNSKIETKKIFTLEVLCRKVITFNEATYSGMRGMDESKEIYRHILDAIVEIAKDKSAKIMGIQRATLQETPSYGTFGKMVSFALIGFIDSSEEGMSTPYTVTSTAIDWANNKSANNKMSQFEYEQDFNEMSLIQEVEYQKQLYDDLQQEMSIDRFKYIYSTRPLTIGHSIINVDSA